MCMKTMDLKKRELLAIILLPNMKNYFNTLKRDEDIKNGKNKNGPF